MAQGIQYEYRFRCAWGGGDALSQPDMVSSTLSKDFTDNIIAAECRLGKSDPDPLAAISSNGRFRATLNNYDDVYNIYGWAERHGNSNVPLPGRDLIVQYRVEGADDWVTLWRGFLLEVKPRNEWSGKQTVEVSGVGPLQYVQDRGYSIAFDVTRYSDYITNPPLAGTVIYDILSTQPAASTAPLWPASRREGWVNGEAGATQIDVVRLFDSLGSGAQLVNPYSVLQQLTKTEFGLLHDNRDGDIVFRNRFWRPVTAAIAQVSSGVREIHENNCRRLELGGGLQYIYNRVVSSATEYVIQQETVLSPLTKTLTSNLGTAVITFDRTDFDPEIELREVIAGVNDYTVQVYNQAGEERPSHQYSTVVQWSRNEIKFTISIGSGDGSHIFEVSGVDVRTATLEEPYELIAENATSINTFGVKEYRFPADLFWFSPDAEQQDVFGVPLGVRLVQDYLNRLVNVYGGFTKNLKLQYKVRDEDSLLASQVSEVIKVTSPTNEIDEEFFFIEGETHTFTNKGRLDHNVTLTLLEAGDALSTWDLEDQNTILNNSTLYY